MVLVIYSRYLGIYLFTFYLKAGSQYDAGQLLCARCGASRFIVRAMFTIAYRNIAQRIAMRGPASYCEPAFIYSLFIYLSLYQSVYLCLSSTCIIYLSSTHLSTIDLYQRASLTLTHTEANKAVISCQVNRGIREASGS